jgi:hypothetical protein
LPIELGKINLACPSPLNLLLSSVNVNPTLENSSSDDTDLVVIDGRCFAITASLPYLFSKFSPVLYGIIINCAGLLRMEMGLKFLSAARCNDEANGALAVVPFVVARLLAVALGLHFYGSVL